MSETRKFLGLFNNLLGHDPSASSEKTDKWILNDLDTQMELLDDSENDNDSFNFDLEGDLLDVRTCTNRFANMIN